MIKFALSVCVVAALASCAAPKADAVGAPSLAEPLLTKSGSSLAEPDPGHGIAADEVNRAADPCVDFFEYANGAWRAAHPIPEGKPRWSHRAEGKEANRRQLQEVVDELSAKKEWPQGSPEQQVGDFQAACMDEDAIEAAGLQPIAPLLSEIDSAKTMSEVQHALRRLHAIAVPALFSITGMLDNAEPLNFIANVGPAGLGLPEPSGYAKTDPASLAAQQKYRAHLAALLELSGILAAQSKAAAESVFALEKRLAAVALDSAAAADPAATDHKTTFAQLQALAPHLDWAAYFEEARLARVDLNVAEPKVLAAIDQTLQDTPVPVWRAYLRVRLLEAAAPWLPKRFAQEAGVPTDAKARAARCLEQTDAQLTEPLARLYLARHFPPAAKARAQEVAQALIATLKEDLAHVDWLTPETRAKAFAKLATYNPKLGYPDRWKDLSGLAIRRSGPAGQSSLWTNLAAARAFNLADSRRLIGGRSDRSWWQLSPASPDAYLDLQLNEIVLPAGFLQPPSFDPSANAAVTFGGFGAALLHDITHAIDEGGSDLDPDGRPKSWWTKADRDQFHERAQCLVEQYDGYFIEPGAHEDGKRVLSEAIGDQAGVQLAWRAFQAAHARHPVPVIDGFTPEQQFFLAWGQLRGESIRIETQRQMLKGDIHAVARFRVNGPLANLPEFQQAFACKPGVPMVREKRCAVW